MAWHEGKPEYRSSPNSKEVRENFAYLKALADLLSGAGVTAEELSQLHESGVVKADFEKLHAITLSAVEANLLDADNRTIGDILTETSEGTMGAIAAVAVGNYLKSAGVAALPAWGKMSLSDTGVKIVQHARTTSGNQVVTGIGFKPSLIILLRADGESWSIGFDNGTSHMCIYFDTFLNIYRTDLSQSIYNGGGTDYIEAKVSALSSDGFTLAYWETGYTGSGNTICLVFH